MSFSVGAPATAKNILAVGATENAGGDVQDVAMRVDFSASGYEAEMHEITPAAFGGSLRLDAPVTAQMVVASPLDGCDALDGASSGSSSECGMAACEARALALGLPFSTQSHSNGATSARARAHARTLTAHAHTHTLAQRTFPDAVTLCAILYMYDRMHARMHD